MLPDSTKRASGMPSLLKSATIGLRRFVEGEKVCCGAETKLAVLSSARDALPREVGVAEVSSEKVTRPLGAPATDGVAGPKRAV
jgi:hypothetical protein